MLAVYILFGLAALCLISIIFLIVLDVNPTPAFFGIMVFALAALITWSVVDNNRVDQYNQETQQLCDAKHGILSKKDGLCYVDNKPVEFSPGVWKR